jgi:hypothetical protein
MPLLRMTLLRRCARKGMYFRKPVSSREVSLRW